MKTLGMAILLALTSASFVMALGPWNSDTAQGAGELEAQGRAGGLMMRWEPPATLPEEPLTGYQLRHRPQTTSQTPAWTTVDVGVVTNHRVSGLTDGTTYDVEVATRTAQGVGTFYASTTGTPGASQCESGTAVTDPSNNHGLVEDCETLLTLKAEFNDGPALNWSDSSVMRDWRGIGLSGTPPRVTSVLLRNKGNYPPDRWFSTIPADLGKLSHLTYLNLNGSYLTGSIPAELGNLANLAALDLSRGDLTGSIPAELGNLTNLTSLDLEDNDLTGTIPTELGNLTNLTSLNLGSNDLTGTIPTELGNLTNLTSLTLGYTDLTGTIPTELGNLTNLTSLNLGFNDLTGTIPTELGNLTNLTSLTLAYTDLTGTIPTELGNLTNLTSLNLGSNDLTGTIPDDLAHEDFRWLKLGGNEFTGCVPPALTFAGGSDVSTLGLPDCPVVTITTTSAPGSEGASLSFTVARSGGTLSDVLTLSLNVAESGDMISGSAPSSVTIPSGETSATVTVATVNDTTPEADSVITAAIARDSGYARGSDSSAEVTVTDDDLPTVTIAANGSPISEGENASFTLTRTGDTTASLVVPVGVAETGATITGTPPASVTIPAGQASVNVTVATEDDTDPESDSTITATLTAGTAYRLGDDFSATVTVRDDDPLVSFMAPEAITEGENAVFTFERVGGVSHELEVSVSVLLTGDFLSGAAPTTVTFTADSTTAELSIPTVDDTTPEADGSIAVLLRQGVDYDITGTLLQQVSVQDNDRPTVTVAAVTTPIDEGGNAVFRVTATGGRDPPGVDGSHCGDGERCDDHDRDIAANLGDADGHQPFGERHRPHRGRHGWRGRQRRYGHALGRHAVRPRWRVLGGGDGTGRRPAGVVHGAG